VVNETLARRYATAIFSLAQAAGAVDRIGADLDMMSSTIDRDPLAREFFVAPVVQRDAKQRAMTASFGGRVHEVALHSVLLLVRKRREALLPAIVGHVAGDALLQPAYVFHQPAFVWSSLTARPLWEASNATTLGERLQMVFQAMDPSRFFESGPSTSFAIIAWVFIASLVLALLAFIRLARATSTLAPA